jgi:hypothetical protein
VTPPVSNALTHRVIDQDRQQAIKHAVLALDTAPGLTQLTELLAAPVASPFDPADPGPRGRGTMTG